MGAGVPLVLLAAATAAAGTRPAARGALQGNSSYSAPFNCSGPSHTIHHVGVAGRSATCVLTGLYESSSFCLVDVSGHRMEQVPFTVQPGGPQVRWDLKFDDQADFNMEYALTCVSMDGNSAQSPKTVFIIGANGPATPCIRVLGLYGAEGNWTSNGDGEDYWAEFPEVPQ